MTEKSVPVRSKKGEASSAFAVVRKNSDQHIIDELIEERCPSFVAHWTWPVVRPLLLSALGYKTAVRWADEMRDMVGNAPFDYLADELDMDIKVRHIDRIPSSGRVVVIANHPTGLADGAAVWDVLMQVRQDVMFLANADAVRIVEGFKDTIIPVEWVQDKRSPAKTRETLRLAGEAFAEEKCIVIFPSGKLAKMIDGKLTEQDWFSTAVGLARKKKAPVVPLNIDARNSSLYYQFARMNGELRDITLFRELINKRRAKLAMTVGPLISPDQLVGDSTLITNKLREYVSYQLPGAPDTAFKF